MEAKQPQWQILHPALSNNYMTQHLLIKSKIKRDEQQIERLQKQKEMIHFLFF